MTDKKSNANSDKATAKNTSKKPTSGTSGKVTKPLRRVNAAKSGKKSSKSDNQSTDNRKSTLFGRLKERRTGCLYQCQKPKK